MKEAEAKKTETRKISGVQEGLTMSKKNKSGCMVFFIGLFAVVFLISMMTGNKKLADKGIAKQPKPMEVSESESVVLCRSAYKNAAKYDSDIGIFSPYSAVLRDGTWFVRVEGKMQNGFGAWKKTVGLCQVVGTSKTTEHFDPGNVITFSIVE